MYGAETIAAAPAFSRRRRVGSAVGAETGVPATSGDLLIGLLQLMFGRLSRTGPLWAGSAHLATGPRRTASKNLESPWIDCRICDAARLLRAAASQAPRRPAP